MCDHPLYKSIVFLSIYFCNFHHRRMSIYYRIYLLGGPNKTIFETETLPKFVVQGSWFYTESLVIEILQGREHQFIYLYIKIKIPKNNDKSRSCSLTAIHKSIKIKFNKFLIEDRNWYFVSDACNVVRTVTGGSTQNKYHHTFFN